MGDFSRSPLDMLIANLQKGYVGLHVEQGVPVLDRDLNLLNDLIMATVRAVITRYIGDGIASGVDGFGIQAIPASNDFYIRAGAVGGGAGVCLVGGLEVTIPADVTYNSQAGLPTLTTPNATQPDPREDTVFLDVWLTEVDGTADTDLFNSADVGIQTSVRQKPSWVVRVAEGVPVPAPAPGHTHYALAKLTRPRGDALIRPKMITDLRQKRLNMADIERRTSALEHILLLPAFDPSPNQFSPKVGMPGQDITLRGRNFDIGTPQVAFGAVSAAIVGAPTNTRIVARVPTMPAGGVKITVTTGGGSVVSDDTFTVLPQPLPSFAPSPNQFSPKTGVIGQNVTLNGNNFNVGTVQVQFGAVSAAIVGTPTATQIVTTVPAGVTGGVKITVTTGAGSAVSDDTFTVI